MAKLFSIESCSSEGNFKCTIDIESQKYDVLPEDIKYNISYIAEKASNNINHMIKIEWAKIHEKEKREKHISELSNYFKSAGFNLIYVKVIENQYSNESWCYKYPWLEVTTNKGIIIIGWRKRVINLDWSESDIDKIGFDIFKNEKTTIGEKYIHCHSGDKAIEYLKMLKD